MKNFTQITVQNFFSFGKEQTLDLSGNGIVNINADNGRGKSSLIIESFCFALYGKTRQEKIDDVVNRYIGKNCKVSVSFIGDDDTLYKVIRYRKHETHNNNVYLFKGDKDISCKNIKDTDAQIQELIGMPYIAFINSMAFSSELFSNFFAAKNSERLVIFENILSLKEVSNFYVETKNILKEIKDKENEKSFILSQKETSVEELNNAITEYTNQAREKLLALKARKEDAKKLLEESENKLKELQELDIEKEREKLGNLTLKQEYEKQISDKKLQANSLIIKEPSFEERELVEKYSNFDFNENKQKEENYKRIQETIKIRETGLEKTNAEMKGLEKEIQNLISEKTSYEEEIKRQENNLLKIKEAICPFCGQKMNEKETQEKRKDAEKIISQRNNDIDEIKGELSDKQNNLLVMQKDYNDLIHDINELKNKLDKSFVSNTELVQEKFLNAKRVIENYELQKIEVSAKLESLKSEITELEAKKEKLELSKYPKEYLDSVKEEIEKQQENVNNAKTEISVVDGSVSSAYDKVFVEKQKESLKLKKDESETLRKEFKEIEEKEKYYNYLADCFSNKSGSFKKYFINEMIPVFVEKLNQYLPFFFNDREIEIQFDKDLNDVIMVDKKEVNFASFSRGQKTRLEISAALALFGMSRIFFSNESGLLVVDEILDQGLDATGVKAAIDILKGFAEDSKVFVVSHNQETKDLIDEVIELKADENGFSYIA